MKYLWMCCVVLSAVVQSARAELIVVNEDTLRCGAIVVGLSRTVEQTFLSEKFSLRLEDEIQGILLYDKGQWSGFDAPRVTRAADTSGIVVSLVFAPQQVESYTGMVAVVIQRLQQQLDTFLIPVVGRGIPLRSSLDKLEFGELLRYNDNVSRTLTLFNDGDVDAPIEIRFRPGVGVFSVAGQGKVVPARGKLTVDITCSPSRYTGVLNETVRDTLLVLTGNQLQEEGVSLRVSARFIEWVAENEALDMGVVVVGSEVSKAVTFTNNMGRKLSIADTTVKLDEAFLFDTQFPADIEAGGLWSGTVVFRPKADGESTTILTLYATINNQKVPLKTIRLTGRGVVFRVPTVTSSTMRVKVGEEFVLPVTAQFDNNDLALLRQSNIGDITYDFTLRFNASITDVLDERKNSKVTADSGLQIVHIAGVIPISDVQPTMQFGVRMRALLGDTDSSAVDAPEGGPVLFRCLIANGTVVEQTPFTPGSIVLSDVYTWPDGTKRLVSSRRGSLVLEIAPNPVLPDNGSTTIRASGFSGTAILTVYTPVGTKVYSDSIAANTPLTLSVSKLGIGRGVYYCRLSSGSNSLVKLLRVE